MRYRVLKVWDEMGKNCKIFLTNRMEEILHPLARNWLFWDFWETDHQYVFLANVFHHSKTFKLKKRSA